MSFYEAVPLEAARKGGTQPRRAEGQRALTAEATDDATRMVDLLSRS